MKRISILTLVVGLLVASACGTSTLPAGQQNVTLADEGSTIYLTVGQTFLLDLGENYAWNISVSDETIVSRVVNITVIRGAQGVYEAHKAGIATLTAIGDPVCRQATPPCAVASILFKITIVVQ